jgi:hypothetical protein
MEFCFVCESGMGKGNKSTLVRESSDFEVSLKPEKAAGKKEHPPHLHCENDSGRNQTVFP